MVPTTRTMSPSYHSQEFSRDSKPSAGDTLRLRQDPGPFSTLAISELVDRIIDHLWDDKASLYRTSLVARLWVHASQWHLLRIAQVERIGGVRDMLSDVHANPEFGAYITTLKMKQVVISTLKSLITVTDLTHNLPRLQNLVIDKAYFSRSNEDYIPHLQGCDKLRSFKLNSCDLKDKLFVSALLQAFPVIDTLVICNPSAEAIFEYGDTIDKLSGGVSINHLIFQETSGVALLEMLIQTFSKNSFRHVTFDSGESMFFLYDQNMLRLNSLITLYMEELEIRTLGFSVMHLEGQNIHFHTPNLRTFRLKVTVTILEFCFDSPLSHLSDAIHHLFTNLHVGERSEFLQSMEYDLRTPEISDCRQDTRVIRTMRRAFGSEKHPRWYPVDVIYDEFELVHDISYTGPEDLFERIRSRHPDFAYVFHPVDA